MRERGFVLTDDQKRAIRSLLSGVDTVITLPTGAGKSLIFQSITCAAAARGIPSVTVIVTPLKSISYTHKRAFEKVKLNTEFSV